MKVGKHTAFLIDFVSRFADGDISRDVVYANLKLGQLAHRKLGQYQYN